MPICNKTVMMFDIDICIDVHTYDKFKILAQYLYIKVYTIVLKDL